MLGGIPLCFGHHREVMEYRNLMDAPLLNPWMYPQFVSHTPDQFLAIFPVAWA